MLAVLPWPRIEKKRQNILNLALKFITKTFLITDKIRFYLTHFRKYKKQIDISCILYSRNKENNEVGDISSLLERQIKMSIFETCIILYF